MRIITFFSIFLFSFCLKADPFETAEQLSMSMDLISSLNEWERELTADQWEAILDNCYNRAINKNARESLIELIGAHSGPFPSDFSDSELDSQLISYCSRYLSLASELGFDLEITPLSTSKQTLNISGLIEDCYSFRANGFSSELRTFVLLGINGSRELNPQLQQSEINAFQVAMGKMAFCGAAFTKSLSTPIILEFIQR